jgi:dihydropyrimidinase
MSKLDMVIRRGEIITSAGSIGVADIGISNGVIVQIGGSLAGDQELDASGKYILPGGIDAHVHLTNPPEEEHNEPSWVDDFTSGSHAALAGGITTLGNISSPIPGETPLETIERYQRIAEEQTITDLFFHPVIDEATPQILSEIPKLLKMGCNSIKIFMVSPEFDSQILNYVKAIQSAGESGLITMVHCEDYALIEHATQQLVAAGKTDLTHYAESRPGISEIVATQRAVAIAEATRAPLYIVHLSVEEALTICSDAKSRNLPVYVETRPLYLFHTKERFLDEDGAKYVGQPPLREQKDIDAIWAGLRHGAINTLCTDHAPWSLAAKLDPAHTITNVRPGVADLQTMIPLLHSEGVRSGRISLGRLVEVTSTNAAKLFGLYPRKGTISVGSDADITIFDPNLELTIENSMLKSNSDYTAFDGWKVTGWPVVTIRRGEIVFRGGKILGVPGSGQVVKRAATKKL